MPPKQTLHLERRPRGSALRKGTGRATSLRRSASARQKSRPRQSKPCISAPTAPRRYQSQRLGQRRPQHCSPVLLASCGVHSDQRSDGHGHGRSTRRECHPALRNTTRFCFATMVKPSLLSATQMTNARSQPCLPACSTPMLQHPVITRFCFAVGATPLRPPL